MNLRAFQWKTLMGFLFLCNLFSCIGDDFVDDFRDTEIRITSNIGALEVSTSFQLDFMYLNNVGLEESVDATWMSSDEGIATVSTDGLVSALAAGEVTISVTYDDGEALLSDSIDLSVGETTVIELAELTGTVMTTTFYDLQGSFTLSDLGGNNLELSFGSDFLTTSALPGLYVYLSNNRNSIASAREIGVVDVFSGAHDYQIENAGINEFAFIVFFCKPFNVKVGDGEIN